MPGLCDDVFGLRRARHGMELWWVSRLMMKAMMLDITTFSPVANKKREGTHALHRVGGRED